MWGSKLVPVFRQYIFKPVLISLVLHPVHQYKSIYIYIAKRFNKSREPTKGNFNFFGANQEGRSWPTRCGAGNLLNFECFCRWLLHRLSWGKPQGLSQCIPVHYGVAVKNRMVCHWVPIGGHGVHDMFYSCDEG